MPEIELTTRQRHSRHCTHTGTTFKVGFAKRVCEDCAAHGDSWVQLRICMTCGNVGCCDSSRNKHARAHFEATGHPIIKTIEASPDWAWCYLDESYLD